MICLVKSPWHLELSGIQRRGPDRSIVRAFTTRICNVAVNFMNVHALVRRHNRRGGAGSDK